MRPCYMRALLAAPAWNRNIIVDHDQYSHFRVQGHLDDPTKVAGNDWNMALHYGVILGWRVQNEKRTQTPVHQAT